MSTLSYNIGEWAGLYVLLELLANGKICIAGENRNPAGNAAIPIMEMLTEDADHVTRYQLANRDVIEVFVNETKLKELDRFQIRDYANQIFEGILNGIGPSFPISGAETIINELYCESVKRTFSGKTAISLRLHELGNADGDLTRYSVKSEVGSPATLLNASKNTNFIYCFPGLTECDIAEVNSIQSGSWMKSRVAAASKKVAPVFVGIEGDIFADNLASVDKRMPELLAEMLLVNFRDGLTECKAITEELEKTNPLRYSEPGIYARMFKKLLGTIVQGMTPGKRWIGSHELSHGFIIMKDDGEIVAYNISNQEEFEEYLLENTKIEHASSSRHDYCYLYTDSRTGEALMKLNLQIRFIK